MTSPTFTFDTSALERELTDLGRRQVPFALSRALNTTANDVQNANRNEVTTRRFKPRSENSRRFLQQSIRRNPGEDFASKLNPVARVRIANRGKASLLGLLDQGGVKSSRFGLTASDPRPAVPVPNSQGAPLPRSLYPAKLGLIAKKKQVKGQKRTFVITTRSGDTLVLQRQSRTRVRTLFLVGSRFGIRARNFFGPTAERVALARFDDNMERALIEALRTAR